MFQFWPNNPPDPEYPDFWNMGTSKYWLYFSVTDTQDQDDYWAKIGTFWNIDYIGFRHAVSPKLSLSRPYMTDINSFLPILNRSEQFEENVHFCTFLVIPLVILFT